MPCRESTAHQLDLLSSERHGLHQSFISTGPHADEGFESVLQRADASRQELGYKDIMVAMMDNDTADSILPHFLSALHDLGTGTHKCLVLVALDAHAMSRCRSLHIPRLCFLLDVSALHGDDGYAYYIDLGALAAAAGILANTTWMEDE